MTLTADIIAQKRDRKTLSEADIRALIGGVVDGSVSDGQLGAFTMAVLLNGMTKDERVSLTLAMRDSGKVLDWDLPGPVLDKHSTGGVGDPVSLILAPALAVCGAFVPMISGRGLGHTGGTLDKLDAIPGYRASVDEAEFARVVGDIGCAIVGQTAALAPADKRLYSIRDVCGTVFSPDLICGSILSKKLAAGLDELVLDIKCGSGAVAKTMKDADALAKVLVEVANGAGCKTSAAITDMNEPLASCAGNALEVAQCLRLLRGDEIDTRLWDVTVHLGGMALHQAGLAKSDRAARDAIAHALQSGAAAEKFAAMVAALGGPTDIIEDFPTHLPEAHVIEEVTPDKAGFVTAIDTQALGRAVVVLGGGRQIPTDKLNYAVGLDWIAGIGLHVDGETPLARVHARTPEDASRISQSIKSAFVIGEKPPAETPLIMAEVGP